MTNGWWVRFYTASKKSPGPLESDIFLLSYFKNLLRIWQHLEKFWTMVKLKNLGMRRLFGDSVHKYDKCIVQPLFRNHSRFETNAKNEKRGHTQIKRLVRISPFYRVSQRKLYLLQVVINKRGNDTNFSQTQPNGNIF